jgi:hypothetical protein
VLFERISCSYYFVAHLSTTTSETIDGNEKEERERERKKKSALATEHKQTQLT